MLSTCCERAQKNGVLTRLITMVSKVREKTTYSVNMYYTHCVDHTPLCNIKVCIVSSHTCCVDYTQSTRLYTDLLHCMHCVVQSMSNYYTIQCKFLPFIWKNLHRAEKFTLTASAASATFIWYACQ